jgi:polyphosphate glucokinase
VKILVVDIGGTHVKCLASGRRVPLKLPSGPHLTPRQMVNEVREVTDEWKCDVVSIGYPGPVLRGRPTLRDPWNLGPGWLRFNYRKAFGRPVRIINDAAMQALGSYKGGNMLFLGLGTGLGSAIVRDGHLAPLELAHLPYRDDESYEEYLGEAGMKELGRPRWRKHLFKIVALFIDALVVEYVVIGGGNARHLDELPPHTFLGNNKNAFKGGFRLWSEQYHAG